MDKKWSSRQFFHVHQSQNLNRFWTKGVQANASILQAVSQDVKPRKNVSQVCPIGQKLGEKWTKPPKKSEKLMKNDNFTIKILFFRKVTIEK